MKGNTEEFDVVCEFNECANQLVSDDKRLDQFAIPSSHLRKNPMFEGRKYRVVGKCDTRFGALTIKSISEV